MWISTVSLTGDDPLLVQTVKDEMLKGFRGYDMLKRLAEHGLEKGYWVNEIRLSIHALKTSNKSSFIPPKTFPSAKGKK